MGHDALPLNRNIIAVVDIDFHMLFRDLVATFQIFCECVDDEEMGKVQSREPFSLFRICCAFGRWNVNRTMRFLFSNVF